MSKDKVLDIADQAKIIVNGYAFTNLEDGFISILNLYHPDCSMVVNRNGDLIETNMDPIEQKLVLSICERNLRFMEE